MEKLLWVVPIVIVIFMIFIAVMDKNTSTQEPPSTNDEQEHAALEDRSDYLIKNQSVVKNELINSFSHEPSLMLSAKNLNKFINDRQLLMVSEHLSERVLVNTIDFELNITYSDVSLSFDLKVEDFSYTFKKNKTTKVIEFLSAGTLDVDEKNIHLGTSVH